MSRMVGSRQDDEDWHATVAGGGAPPRRTCHLMSRRTQRAAASTVSDEPGYNGMLSDWIDGVTA